MLSAKINQCQSLLAKSKTPSPFSHKFLRLFENQLNLLIRDEFTQKFWSHYDNTATSNKPLNQQPFLSAISFLKKACDQIDKTLAGCPDALRDKFYAAFKTQIFAHKPHYLSNHLEATYSRAFRIYLSLKRKEHAQTKVSSRDDVDFRVSTDNKATGDDEEVDEEEEEEEEDNSDEQMESGSNLDANTSTSHRSLNACSGCYLDRDDSCECQQLNELFCEANDFLRHLELLDGLVGDTVMNVCRLFIERRVLAKCKSNYSVSYLSELKDWVQNIVKQWIVNVYGLKDTSEIDSVNEKLLRYLKDSYAEVRVSHMFEIIIEYPNSGAAIYDLKACLEESSSLSFRLNLIKSVKQSLIESLLHPGVNTYDILTAYISAIKALRALDPSGLILQLVTEPVRRYLKSRNDTVRCIVTALTDEDNNSELNREMVRSSTQTNENGMLGKRGTIEMSLPNEGENCTSMNFEKWKPDPIKISTTDELMKSNRFSDIVSILVNIYETKDLFVEEYQKLLSQRLLNKYDECNLDIELRNLELLTIRFSDCELHRCEVMLKDVQTSKRINKRILSGDIRDHKLENKFKNLDVLIVSSPFWPDKFSPMASLRDELPSIKFPAEIEEAIETYTKAFEAIQASRTLHWRHHLGTVNMDVTIGDKTQNFAVSPLHASILCLFQEKKSWKLNELMQRTFLPAATLRSRLALWQRNGLIRDSGEDKYDLIGSW